MRLLLLLSIVGFTGIVSIVNPFIGLISYSWLAYFRPQNLVWWAPNLRLSFFVAIMLIFGVIFNGRRENFTIQSRENKLMIILLVILGVSTIFAFDTSEAFAKLIQMGKIILIAILTGALLNSEKRFKYFAWFIALIFGFLAVKGAIRGLFSGWHLRGPAESMIADNNEFALALNMVLPFFLYLGMNEKIKWRKRLFYLQFPFIIIAIIYTFSRGGFIGLCAVILFLVLKSKRKILGFTSLALGAALFFNFAPQEYKERIDTIKIYQEDTSVMGRIYAWKAAWEMAKDKPLTGVGLRNFMLAYPNYHWSPPKVAHNSFLQLLAEGGFIALGIFLLLLYFSIKKLRYLRKFIPVNEKTAWLHNYSHMLEIGLIAYMVSGFFLSRADFDLMYQFIGMVVALENIAQNEKLITK